MSGAPRSGGAAGAWQARLRMLPAGTRRLAAAAAALVVSLAAPKVPLPADSWNHVVVVDITQSMNARDMTDGRDTLDRLAFVRRSLRRAAAQLPCGSRLGFGVFTEYRMLLLLEPVEVCASYSDLPGIIDRIDGRMAWGGASEVAKGAFSSVRTLRLMPGKPTLVFVSDGHEAPPLRPGERPRFDDPSDEIRGTVAGVGGDEPVPIPKFDLDGHPLGVWAADEVMQTDTISLGQTLEGAKQTLVDEAGRPVQVYAGSGSEHLSSLKEAHLREVAEVGRLGYRRLREVGDLSRVLRDPALARRAWIDHDLRPLPLGIALLLIVSAFLPRQGAWRSVYKRLRPALSTRPGAAGVDGVRNIPRSP